MTLQQLRYVTTVAETGTISGAAKALFISQPSLTAAIQELEKEMGITIFLRTNRGVVLSREGDEFLGYARQVLMQAELLEDRYGAQSSHRQQFAVSARGPCVCPCGAGYGRRAVQHDLPGNHYL